jgi:cytochrome c6
MPEDTMKKKMLLTLAAAVFLMQATSGCSREWTGKATPEQLAHGGELFSQHCAGCHPDGGNLLYPQKNLHRLDLAANGITTPAGIVTKMRHPGRGMKQFDKSDIPDNYAFELAQYILVTFK